VAGGVPVADEHGELVVRRGERDGDQRAAVDADRAEAAGGFVESQRREVEEAADLVLSLHAVSEVLARRDGAVGAGQAILPRILALLQTVPADLAKCSKSVDRSLGQYILTEIKWSGYFPNQLLNAFLSFNMENHVGDKSLAYPHMDFMIA
jgi:hypothetical protein